MIKGVIFDFDGVIADTEPKKFELFKKILKKYNYSLEDEDFPNFIGKRTAFFLKERFSSVPEDTLQAICNDKNKNASFQVEEIRLVEGILDLLKFLKQNKYKLAISSGTEMDFINKLLQTNNLDNYFDVIISKEDNATSKPNPECYQITLKKMQLAPQEVIIIEDSFAGIKAGKAAGCKVFAITNHLKFRDLEAADFSFQNHTEILDYLRQN